MDDITPGNLGQWDVCDWFDPETWAAIQWHSLPEAERNRAEAVQRAMDRARQTNPLAY